MSNRQIPDTEVLLQNYTIRS